MNLAQRQALPLDSKIALTQRRIKEWFDHWDGLVYVAFSGGKDSTVLKHLVETTPGVSDVPSVFCNTGLEYPEVRQFAISQPNVTEIHSEMNFKAVIEKYGYPVISKEQAYFLRQYRTSPSATLRAYRWDQNPYKSGRISQKWRFLVDAPFAISEQCCTVMKKRPFHQYEKVTGRHPMLGMMAGESNLRHQRYSECNLYTNVRPMSNPMTFWTEQDVLDYLLHFDISYALVYGDIIETPDGFALTGESRTGCMFCMFGVQHDSTPNRFRRMAITHPRQYDYCMNELGLASVLDFMGVAWE